MKRIFRILNKTADNSRLNEMDRYTQHGSTSTLMHTIAVAHYSVALARRFLYDWHDKHPDNRMHGFTHASKALKNADKDFRLNKRERDIIAKHMFPLTIKPPTTREGWLVCLVDKGCSLLETFGKDPYCGLRNELKTKNSELYKKHKKG